MGTILENMADLVPEGEHSNHSLNYDNVMKDI